MKLRQYQEDCVTAIYDHLRTRQDNPCAVIPTGGGKTPVIATICRDVVTQWNGRVLILAHVKELLEQTIKAIEALCPELIDHTGVYSASLKKRDTNHSVIIAGIQSVYNKACTLGKFDCIIIDEAHLIPPSGEGRYLTFIRDALVINPKIRVIGLTATPYRMTSGMICDKDNVLNEICYEVGIKDLIEQGYLCNLRSKAAKDKPDFDDLHIQAGEFIANEVERLMDTDKLVESSVTEILEETESRTSCLIFASSIVHAKRIIEKIESKVENFFISPVGFVCGDTPVQERDETIRRFKSSEIKYLVNVNVLTTGFDAPNVDCIALVRPTASPGLYYQMVGRGFRQAPNKKDCLVLDFGGNVMRHGPVDMIRIKKKRGAGAGSCPAKTCPNCRELVFIAATVCPECGFVFPEREISHETKATELDILSGQTQTNTYKILKTTYSYYDKKGTDKWIMKVSHLVNDNHYEFEWICLEHEGYAKHKASVWWSQRCNEPVPNSCIDATHMARSGYLAQTKEITVKITPGEKYPKIVGYVLEDKPEITPELVNLLEHERYQYDERNSH